MARTPKIPAYSRHASGHARCQWPLGGGRYHVEYFPGPYNSPQSRAAYDAAVARWLAAGRAVAAPAAPPAAGPVSWPELVRQFTEAAEAEGFYRKAGRRTSQWAIHRAAFAWVLGELLGQPAGAFTLADLDRMRGAWRTTGLSPKTVRTYTAAVKGLLRWGEGRGLVPVGHTAALDAADRGLGSRTRRRPAGRRAGVPLPLPDPFAVGAVALAAGPPLCSMIWLQRLNGMRPEGLVTLRPRDLDRVGDLVRYREPAELAAKTGAEVHWLGPRAQAVVAPYVAAARSVDDFLFRPSV